MSGRNLTYEALLARLRALERENAELRERLDIGKPAPKRVDFPPVERKPAEQPRQPSERIHIYSPPQDKIALFRSLFHGREDVFALRWQSAKTGKNGYSPACRNEWRPGVCLKPKGRCSDCEHRELLPLTDERIDRHLRGKDELGRDVIGIYPILPDDTCRFLALDFDDESWQENVALVRGVCDRWELPCAVERSRKIGRAHV